MILITYMQLTETSWTTQPRQDSYCSTIWLWAYSLYGFATHESRVTSDNCANMRRYLWRRHSTARR